VKGQETFFESLFTLQISSFINQFTSATLYVPGFVPGISNTEMNIIDVVSVPLTATEIK
jgi:hypothetical protein